MVKKIKSNVNKISKSMSFSELIQEYPEAREILMNNGMHCFGCAMASFETLEQGCIAHGMNPDTIIGEINKKLERRK